MKTKETTYTKAPTVFADLTDGGGKIHYVGLLDAFTNPCTLICASYSDARKLANMLAEVLIDLH